MDKAKGIFENYIAHIATLDATTDEEDKQNIKLVAETWGKNMDLKPLLDFGQALLDDSKPLSEYLDELTWRDFDTEQEARDWLKMVLDISRSVD